MSAQTGWLELNQRYLMAEVARVRRALAQNADVAADLPPAAEPSLADFAGGTPPASVRLTEAFGLSPFERDVLLLCAATELDGSVAPLCAHAAGDLARPYPTFGLALAVLAEPHWSALAPVAPLRRWRLIELVNAGFEPLANTRLRIDERVLHHLAGLDYLDERLTATAKAVMSTDVPTPEQAELVAALTARQRSPDSPATIQLCGDDRLGKRAVAAAACRATGGSLYELAADDLPANAQEREVLARLWEREAVLSGAALLLDTDGSDASPSAAAFAGELNSPLFIAGREPLHVTARETARFDVNRPRWQNPQAIRAAAPPTAGSRMDELAQHIEPLATWDDLVLPEPQRATLREITAHVRQMPMVYGDWGFAGKSTRGLGISALFSGASGTGKTMAAEVLANELALDLYRIDLSAVVSKYIGETEKNLRRLFDAAEETGAILLFDEADALFGKRSEVKDSHDRYANIEVSYLLQRMEAYRGLAILTTNFRAALDPAFLRRIRFIVNFPFPDAAQRAEIWRRVFPVQTPVDGINFGRLTQLNVAGGNIRNIAMNAAFLAADAGQPVGMTHLLAAARGEYAKLEKPMSDAEFRNW
jgi:AAA+ superfamily predicted ATPase